MAYSLERIVKDEAGVPQGGALVYVYNDNGLLASLVTALGAPTDNPAVANELGYAPIFVSDVGKYRLDYYWAGRKRLIELTIVDGGSVSSLPASTDGTLAGNSDGVVPTQKAVKTYVDGPRFTQTGTGAVARTVQAKLRDVVSAKDYGAVGDGATNDAGAVALAQSALSSPANGAKQILGFTPGNYLVSGLGTLQRGECWSGASPAYSYGAGRTSTNLLLNGTPVNSNYQPFVTISNLTLDGGGVTDFGFVGGFVSRLEAVNIIGCTDAGLRMPVGAQIPQTSYYNACTFNGNRDGVSMDSSGGLAGTQWFSHCLVRDNTRFGINGQFQTSNFHGVVFESNAGSGVNLTGNNNCLSFTGGSYFEQNDTALGANGYHVRMDAIGKGVVTFDAVKFGSTDLTKVAKIDNGRVTFRNCVQDGDVLAPQLLVSDTAEVWVDNSFYGFALPPNVKIPPRVNVSPNAAIVFGGAGQSIDISAYSTVFGSANFTVSAVVECDASGAVSRQIFIGALGSFQLALSGAAGGTPNISFGKYGSPFVATVAGDIPVNCPVHLAYVRTSGVGKLYQNGVLIWTGADANNYSGALTYIGELNGLNGKLYAAGWHTAALTSQQVFDVWRCGGDLNAAGINATANMLTAERAPGYVWFNGASLDAWASMTGGVQWATVSGSALAPYTVATLPAGYLGAQAIVVDASAPAFLSPVVGGGAVVCRVWHNGTTWVVG